MTDQDDVVLERDGFEEDGTSEDELEAVESRTDAKVQKLKKELDVCKKERQEHLDGWQRAKADYVNALKRFEEERAAAHSTGLLTAVRALLPGYDALERAKSAGELPEGFQSIAKQLERSFASLEVTPFGVVGEPFDPARHEALGTDPTDDVERDNTVSAVLEQGYALKEHVIRPARVRVAHQES